MSAAALLTQAIRPPPASGSTGLLLQRKWACEPPASGRMERKSKRPLQTKLTIGTSNDPLEQEADRIADQVLAAPARSAISGLLPPRIQRYAAPTTGGPLTAPDRVNRILAESGAPLAPALRRDMEQRFGYDFSRVRVHSGDAAERSVREVNAVAYTVGHNMVFGAGRFQPASHEGRRLIAHELTHVVQQSASDARHVGQDHGAGDSFASSQAPHEGASGRQPVTVNGAARVYLARAPEPGVASGVAEGQGRTEKMKRAFTPRSGDADTALIEVMEIIESIRPSESASGLYSLVRDGEVITITTAEYDKIRASAQKTLRDGLRKVRQKAEDARLQYGAQHEIDEDQWFVSGAVRLFGGIHDPGEEIAQNLRFATVNADTAQVFIERGQLARAAMFFGQSERFATIAKKASQAYVDNVISTAETTVTVLEVTAVTAAAAVVVIGVILAAPVVVPAVTSAARAVPLAFQLATATAPAAPVVATEVAAVTAPAAAAVAAPAVAAPAVAVAATPAAAAVAAPTVAAVAAPAVVASPSLSTAALATAALSTTLSSDSPGPVGAEKEKKEEKKKRPPFVLRLPLQKAPHLLTYIGWLGRLQSDPDYDRDDPAQLEKWHRALRIGGSDAIPADVYDRGHTLGLAGRIGERRIRVPDWSRTTESRLMEVDHIVELQLTPAAMREEFDSVPNYELLDRTSNRASGGLLRANIAAERAKQVAFDPSTAKRILLFDQVVLGGGTPGERWSVGDLQTGAQLNAYEKHHASP
jgi:hypothetical protein